MISTLKRKNLIITVTLVFVIALLLINFAFTFRNYEALSRNNTLKIEAEQIKQQTELIISVIIHGADLSVRGYGITKNEVLLDPINQVLPKKDTIFANLEKSLKKQNYDLTDYNEMKYAVNDYLKFSVYMIQLARQDSMKLFVKLLNEDRGYLVWKKYEAFYKPLFDYEDTLNAKANEKYLKALYEDRVIQIVLLLLCCPTILYIIKRLQFDEKEREGLLTALDQSNRKYIFDSNEALETKDWKEIVADSIKNFQHANEFITKISTGDYTTEWNGVNESNRSHNQTNLAGNLTKMRESLKQTKVEDEQRNWSSVGQAKFAETIRHENDFQKLGDMIVSYIVKYTNSNQGGLFVLKDENKDDIHLSLLSCYAWDKKKFIEKDIYEGQGVVGQCWLEGEPIFMTHVPADYVNITSGLGQATPRSIFIVPLKVNNVIYGILELASFQPYQQHERQFILAVCETIASAISNTKITAWTNHLLEQSQKQAEELRSQEEEMRQNVEELLATQESVQRVMEESKNKELYMRNLIDASTDSVITFDHEYKIIHSNKAAINAYQAGGFSIEKEGVNLLKLMPPSEQLNLKQRFDKALSGEFVEMTYQSRTSRHYTVKYIPIKNENGKVTAVAQFSTDVTVLMNAQEETKLMLQKSQAQTEELRAQEEELRATMEAEAQRAKDLERANSQSEAQKLMMTRLIEKLKDKEKVSQVQAIELSAQQEAFRQTMEEHKIEAERCNTQLEAQSNMMTATIEKFNLRENELLAELELKEKYIANLTKVIRDN